MGTLFWGPYNKDPTIQGTILGSPTIFGNSHIGCRPVEGFPQEVQTSSPRILNESSGVAQTGQELLKKPENF